MKSIEESILEKWGSENILNFILTGKVPQVELSSEEIKYLNGEKTIVHQIEE
jgi:hypothetical protein